MPPESTPVETNRRRTRFLAVVDVLLVFVVFAADGAWPVPDVNEAHYLTKAKHFLEPDWCGRDIFLASADSHVVFFATFGYLTQIMSLPAAAWCGRVIQWLLLAWGWRRLSFAVAPKFGWAAITGAAAVAIGERFHMAGEWIVGGCEAKVVAYALVFSGLADLVRGRWNRTLLQFGAASAYHVLVGGWSFVAAGTAWLVAGRDRPVLSKWLPGLVVGGLFALAGLWPAMNLGQGVDAATSIEANRIYVDERLAHHLDPRYLVEHFGSRQFILWASWIAVCFAIPATRGLRRLRHFTLGAGLLALVGLAIGYFVPVESSARASLLRFYWFRLADVMPAIGLSLEAAAFAASSTQSGVRRLLIGVLAAIGAAHLVAVFVERAASPNARSENLAYPDNLESWRDVCHWIRKETPRDALFLTPRPFGTFNWYAERADAGVWKNVPQDARSLVEWRRRLNELYFDGAVWLNYVPLERIRRFARKYDVDYLVTYREPPLALPQVYANNDFVVYSLAEQTSDGS